MGLDRVDGDGWRRWWLWLLLTDVSDEWAGHKDAADSDGTGLAIQLEVLVLLAKSVQLNLQLLNAPALGLQELLLALYDVVELQEVLHSSIGAVWAALPAGIHGCNSATLMPLDLKAQMSGLELSPPTQFASGGERVSL